METQTTAALRHAAAGLAHPHTAATLARAHIAAASIDLPGGAPAGAAITVPPYTPIGAAGTGLGTLDSTSLLLLGGKFLLVLALLLLSLRILRALLPRTHRPGTARPGALLLHTETIIDKQRICLLDLEGSLIVIGVTATGITPLTTITDPETAHTLRARYAAPATTGRAGITAAHRAPAPPRTFAAALAGATHHTAPPPREPRPTPAHPGAPDPRNGDPILNHALTALRTLRQKVEST